MNSLIVTWIIVLSASINFGFMLFDGVRALTIGDYLRPKSGHHKGLLGPWSKLVRTIGIDPESILMKRIFVYWGSVGIIITFLFLMNIYWAWWVLLIYSFCSIWYLVPGTILSILQVLLLIILNI